MLLTTLTVTAVFVLLLIAEYGSRTKNIHAELSRKFVHLTVGTFVAFWPFFLSWHEIELLSVAFLVVVGISIKLNIFRSIHAVDRNATGEVLFAMAIGFTALITSKSWIFMAAMLHLSLADGLAAIVGLLWGDKNQYKVFGNVKSLAGSTAFFICSFFILAVYLAFAHADVGYSILLWLPLVATVAENLAVAGTDNLVLPLLIATVLSSNI